MPAAATPLSSRIAAEHAALLASLPAEVAAPERHRAALESLVSLGLPTVRDDAWKYANLRPLERARFAPAPRAVPGTGIAPVDPALPAPLPGFDRYVIVDGRLDRDASAALGARGGVSVEQTADASFPRLEGGRKDDRFALLNEAFALDALQVTARSGAAASRGIELLFAARTPATEGTSYPRVAIELQPGASLRLVERHIGAGESASLANSACAVRVAAGATLDHYRVQDAGARATWLDTLQAALEERATYRLTAVAFGALSARSTLLVRHEGRDSQLTLDALSLADGQQVQDVHALVRHCGTHATTSQTFRGIAAGRARVAFNGLMIVDAGAAGTDSRQSLRGLLAGPEAEIDVRPQLEIYTDEVQCSHGATAGKLDEAMLFYLLSRGLDRDTAQSLLKWAFLEDVVARIALPELRNELEHRIAGRLRDPLIEKELL
jgi:Fe-S cluster assembly protein SufD